ASPAAGARRLRGTGAFAKGGKPSPPVTRCIPAMLRLTCALAAAFATAACASLPAGTTTAIAPGEISEATMKEVTRTLSADEFEGRAPGTEGEAKTIAHLVEQFERAGLQPGNQGSWFQAVPLVEITASAHEPLTIAGKSYTHGADWVGV